MQGGLNDGIEYILGRDGIKRWKINIIVNRLLMIDGEWRMNILSKYNEVGKRILQR